MFRVHTDANRYREVEPGVYVAGQPGVPPIEIHLHGSFGDAYLA
jgi:hypothetical protein